MRTILTVTPNPSLDLLFETRGLVYDDANRLDEPRRRPGGQGINATRAVRRLGGESVAVALLGGAEGREIEAALEAEGTPLVAVAAAHPTRLFIAVHDLGDGRNLLLNMRGPRRDAAEADALFEATLEAIDRFRPAWAVGSGSLPPGFPDTWYRDLARSAKVAGCNVVIDCDGPALRMAAEHCDLLVPNRYEAGRLLGVSTPATVEEAAAAALDMLALGPTRAAVTLGPDGAVLAQGQEAWHARAPEAPGTAVGAGDAFLAGLLLALNTGQPCADALVRATAAAAGALTARGLDILDADRSAAVLPGLRPHRVSAVGRAQDRDSAFRD